MEPETPAAREQREHEQDYAAALQELTRYESAGLMDREDTRSNDVVGFWHVIVSFPDV
jgi:hypothetical protein